MKKCPHCGLSIEDDIYQCGYCQSDLTGKKETQPYRSDSGVERVYSGSYVYVATNSAMSGLVKIGHTDDLSKRSSQLFATNVPNPFKFYGFVKVNNPKEVEKAVHKKLANYRTSRSREFFRIGRKKALEALENVSGQFDLKRQQEAAEAAKWEREKAARKKQEQLEQEIFEAWNIESEKIEERINYKLYKKLEDYSGALGWIIFICGIVLSSFVNNEVLILIGIAWAVVGAIHLISSKIEIEKRKYLKKDIDSIMEARFGKSWHAYKKR